jgi:hypothetical protein
VEVTEERQRAAQERVQAARETVARLRAGARAEEIEAAVLVPAVYTLFEEGLAGLRRGAAKHGHS